MTKQAATQHKDFEPWMTEPLAEPTHDDYELNEYENNNDILQILCVHLNVKAI